MSTQLTGASAKVLFESPAQLNLKKKLLKEGNFEIVSSGPESATNLDKGITVVRTKQEVSRDALTDEPVYEYKEFEVKHPRENIADVFRRRLPRDAAGQLTVPGLTGPTMAELNTALQPFAIYLEPKEFTLNKQGAASFNLTAKNNCIIFYGKIHFTNTVATTAPKEVYEAEAGTGDGDGDGEGEPSGDAQIFNLAYSLASNQLSAVVVNARTAMIATSTGFSATANVVDEEVNYTFQQVMPLGTEVKLSAKDAEERVYVNPPLESITLEHEPVGAIFNKNQLAVKIKTVPANYVLAVRPGLNISGNVVTEFTDNSNILFKFDKVTTPDYSNIVLGFNVDGITAEIKTLYVAPLPNGEQPTLENLGYDTGSKSLNFYTNVPSLPVYALVNGELVDEVTVTEMTMFNGTPGFMGTFTFETMPNAGLITLQQGQSSLDVQTPWVPDMANPLTVTVTEVTATGLKGKASKYDEMGNVKITLASDAEAVFNVGLSNKGEFVWDYSNPLLDGEVVTFTVGADTVEYTVNRA